MLLGDMTWPDVKALDFDRLIVVLPTGSFEQHGPHLPLTTDTDIVTAIATRLEQQRSDRVLLLPTLWPGLSTHHMHFPGTMDVPQTDYIRLVTNLGKSIASMGAKKCFILNGHGGNDVPIRAAPRELKSDVPQTDYIRLVTNLGKSIASMGAKKCFILNGHGGNDVPIRAALRELKSDVPQTRFVFASYWTLAAQSIKQVRESELGGLGHACEMETSIMLHLHPDRVKMDRAIRSEEHTSEL